MWQSEQIILSPTLTRAKINHPMGVYMSKITLANQQRLPRYTPFSPAAILTGVTLY